jgi:Cu(I)/Ag(I) efflux system membrane fusion protein
MTGSFGLENDRVFKNFCPMAFNDKGAFWLSEIKDIRYPHYGSAMLNCGEVKETYLKGQRVFENQNPTQNVSAGG